MLDRRINVIQSRVARQARHLFWPELLAGLTVSMVAVPQGMGYAAIVGVNPLYGLYTAIVPAIIGALFGSSNHLITGPTNATALATASVLLAYAGQPNYVEYVFAVAVITGLIRLVLGLLRLGGMIRYVSHSVLTGFLAGAGILIVVNQLHSLLGLVRPAGANTVTIVADVVQRLPLLNPYVLATGLLTVAFLLAGSRWKVKIPAALLAIALVGLLVQAAGWSSRGVLLIRDLGPLAEVIPAFHVPRVPFRDQLTLVASAVPVALLSLVEAMSIAYTIMLASRQYVDPSQEFVGQGLASLVGGFFRCIPSSGSLARSAVAYSGGARTRLAGVLSGVLVLLMLLAFSHYIGYIPVASLAGVVIVSAQRLIDYERLSLTWQSPATNRVVLGATFVSTLVLPLHLAILLGTLLSIGAYLHESSNIRVSYLCPGETGGFEEHGLQRCLDDHPSIALINLEGILYFAAVDDLQNKLEEVLQAGVRVLILRVRRFHLLAGAGISAFRRIFDRAEAAKATVLISGVSDDFRQILESAELAGVVDSDQTFVASNSLFESTDKALQRAKEILAETERNGL